MTLMTRQGAKRRNPLGHRLLFAALTTTLMAAGIPTDVADSPVADAAMRGDIAGVRALLENGADMDAAQGDGMTALHWAAVTGNAELAALLIAGDAYLEGETRLGAYRPLHLAAKNGNAAILAALLDAGAEVDSETATGAVTALHFASASGIEDAVRTLIDHGADVGRREGTWGQTPLMFAAASGRAGTAKLLVDAGADPDVIAEVLDMPTRDAQDREDEARSRELRGQTGRSSGEASVGGAGAGPGTPPTARVDPNEAQRDRGAQRLSAAELIGGYGGLSALLLAVREGHVQAATQLLDLGADINLASGGDHTTPLLMASINGHFDLAMELFQRGADPSIASGAGATPLYVVLNTEWIPKSRHPQPTHRLQQEVTYLDLMRAFLDHGVDPNLGLTKQLWFTTFGDDYLGVDRGGATPFWRAAYALDIEAMRMLVSYGADSSSPTLRPPARARRGGPGADAPGGASGGDPSGLPPVPVGGPGVWPIHAASGVGYGEGFAGNIHRHAPEAWLPAVRYLVEERGADVNARDHNGYNAIHHAASRGDNELILYLVQKGGDVSAVSRAGQTTVDMANGPAQRISPFPETIALLEGLGAKNNHNCVGC